MARKRPAKWMQHGVTVDYHSVIGGPVTQAGLRIESGPHQLGRGGPWVVWLHGKSGCVSIEAITRAPLPSQPEAMPPNATETVDPRLMKSASSAALAPKEKP